MMIKHALFIPLISAIILAVGVVSLTDRQENLSLGGPTRTIIDIEQAQELYRQQNGKYLQVGKNNEVQNANDTTRSALGKPIPDHWKVNTYKGPKGEGFFVEYEEGGNVVMFGFGPHGQDFTKTYQFGNRRATTTP